MDVGRVEAWLRFSVVPSRKAFFDCPDSALRGRHLIREEEKASSAEAEFPVVCEQLSSSDPEYGVQVGHSS